MTLTTWLKKDWQPPSILLLTWLMAWSSVLLGDRVLYMRDLTFFALPMKKVWMEAVLSGHFPLWTPYISCGLPFLADLSQQALYPLNGLFLLGLPVQQALSVFLAVHQGLALGFAWLLLRVLGVRPWLAVWGAFVYGFSGYVLSITDNVNYLPSVAWLPAAMAGWYWALSRRQWPGAVASAVALALMVLAGDVLSASVFGVWAVGLWLVALLKAFWRWYHAPNPATEPTSQQIWQHHLTLAAHLGGWTLALTAAQLLPTLEMVALSVRQTALNLSETMEWSFPPHRLIELVVPYFYGTKYPTHAFIGQFLYPHFREPWANSVYIGLLPLGLAAWACWQRSMRYWPWLLLAVGCLFFSFGSFLPGHDLIFKVFTLFNQQRYLEKLLLPATLGLTVLATLGAQQVWDRRDSVPVMWQSTAWPLRLLYGGLVVAASLLLLVQLPAESWIWPHLQERAFEWQNTAGVDRSAHVQGLLWHTALWTVAVLGWLALPLNRHGRGPFKAHTLRHWGLLALLMGAALNSGWVNGSTVVTDSTAVFQPKQPPAIARILGPLKAQNPQLRVFYDDTYDIPEYYGHQALIEEIGKARGLSYTPLLPDVYWSYRVRNSMERGLFNAAVMHGLPYQNGRFSPLQPKTHHQMDKVLIKDHLYTLLRVCGVTHSVASVQPATPSYEDTTHFRLVEAAPVWNMRVFEVINPLPRAYLAPNELRNEDPMVMAFFSQAMKDLRHQVEVALPPTPAQPTTTSPAWIEPLPGQEAVHWNEDQAGQLRLTVQNPYAQGAWLVVLESYFPGWQAQLDGQPTPVIRANHRMMAVRVPQGQHTLSLVYRSVPFERGVWVSAVAWLLVLAGAGLWGYRSLTSSSRQPKECAS